MTAIDAFLLFGKIVTHIYVIPKNDILQKKLKMKIANPLFLLNIFVITTVTTIEVYNIIIVKIVIHEQQQVASLSPIIFIPSRALLSFSSANFPVIQKIGIMNIINMNNGKKLLRPLASRRALFDYINGFDCIGPNPIYC